MKKLQEMAQSNDFPKISKKSEHKKTEELVDDSNGLIFKSDDADSLKEAIESLIKDEILRDKMSIKAIEFVRDNFDMTILLIEHDMSLVSVICEKLSVVLPLIIILSDNPFLTCRSVKNALILYTQLSVFYHTLTGV